MWSRNNIRGFLCIAELILIGFSMALLILAILPNLKILLLFAGFSFFGALIINTIILNYDTETKRIQRNKKNNQE